MPAECQPEPAAVTSPGTDPWAEFVPTWIETICANIAPCCDAATFDPNRCRSYYTGLLSGLPSGDPSHYAYDAAAAETCLADTRTDLAMCRNGFGSSCTYVQRGLERDGEACVKGGDCASGTCQDTGNGSKCGRPHALLDAPCAESCSLGDYGSWSCYGQPSQAEIGLCFAEDGLFCSLNGKALGPLDGSGATCQPLRARGEACESYLECADGFCVAGVCTPDPGGGVGSACPCKLDLNCVDGSCQEQLGLGAACEPGLIRCGAGMACRSGKCQCGGYIGSYIAPLVCSYD